MSRKPATPLASQPMVFAGVDEFNNRLANVTPEEYARQAAADIEFLARLDVIPRDALSDTDQLNYDLFRFDLESRMALGGFDGWRIPFLSDYGFYSEVMSLADNLSFRAVKDYEDYISRLNDTPRFFDENIANMRTGIADGFVAPRVIVNRVIPAIATQVSVKAEDTGYFEPFNDFPLTFSDQDKERLTNAGLAAIEDNVLPAFEALHTFMVDEYEPQARDTIGISAVDRGADYYEALVRYYTTLDLSAGDVHQIGLEEVARIRAEMEVIIENVGFEGTFADFLEFLRTDPQFYAKSAHELLAEASYFAKRIDGQMPIVSRPLKRCTLSWWMSMSRKPATLLAFQPWTAVPTIMKPWCAITQRWI